MMLFKDSYYPAGNNYSWCRITTYGQIITAILVSVCHNTLYHFIVVTNQLYNKGKETTNINYCTSN